MKNIMIIMAMLLSSVYAFAQTDSLPTNEHQAPTLAVPIALPTHKATTTGNDTIIPEAAAAEVSGSNPTDFKQNVVVMPSPDMVGLINQVNAGVDLFTGKATVNLPIYTLKSYDIEVPISINHASNGVKVDEIGTSVGLSWSLNAGGAITRVMKNSPDESVRLATYFAPYESATKQGIWVFGYLALKKKIDASLPNGFDINTFATLPERTKMKIIDYSNWFPVTKFKNFYDDGLFNVGFDTEPDEFYFKFGSYSGKFVFNPDGKILCIPEYKFKIEPTINVVDNENKIVAFKVTTLEGYTYYFGDTDLKTVEKTMRKVFQNGQSYYYESNATTEKRGNIDYSVYKSTPIPLQPFQSAGGIEPYTSAWHLNKIESPSGDVVTLAYDNVDIQYVDNRSYSSSVPNFRVARNSLSQPNLNNVVSRVAPTLRATPIFLGTMKRQVYPTYALESHSISILYVNSKKLRTISTQNNNELVFKADANRVDIVGGKKLEEITLYLNKTATSSTSIYSKKWKLNYSEKIAYPNDNAYPSEYRTFKNTKIKDFITESWGYINAAAGAENQATFEANQFKVYKSEFNRMLLTGVDEIGYVNPTLINTLSLYKLNYFYEDKITTKRFDIYHQDRNGYYGASSGMSGVIGYINPDNANEYDLVNKILPNSLSTSNFTDAIDFHNAITYSLSTITNSLGGLTQYSYSIAKNASDGKNADIKVNRISTTTGGKTLTKTFEYIGVTTPNKFPKMYQTNVLAENSVPYEGVVVYSSKPYDLNLIQGSLYVSNSVKVTEGGNGSTQTWFRRTNTPFTKIKKIGTTTETDGPNYPFPQMNDYEWQEGAPYQTEIKNEAGNLVKKSTSPSTNAYLWGAATSTILLGAPTTQGLKGVRISIKDKYGNTAKNEHQYGLFSYVSAAPVTTESQEIDYFENTSTTITKTTTSAYSNTNNRIRSQTTTNSDGTVYKEAYKYAFDYTQTTSTGTCDPVQHSYKRLVDKNMIGIPLETATFVNAGTIPVNGSKVIYDCEARPKYFYKFGTNGAECLSYGDYRNPDWFLTYQIAEYETFGRAKTVKYACNDQPITLTWDKDKILSKTYGTRVWTYVYNTQRLLEKFTDFDGLVSEFKYDEFFRLKESKGKNSTIINAYTYTFGAENSVAMESRYLGSKEIVLKNKQIMDGFGRVLSATKIGFTPSGGDITANTNYDNLGRPVSEIDPTKGTTAKSTLYEQSPLNRVLTVTPHGSDKPITYKYGVNEELLTVSPVGQTDITYAKGTLYISTVLDEDGKPSISYTDKLGRTIMTRKPVTATTFADTKYSYNDRGQVLQIIPPDKGDPFRYEYNTDGSLLRKTIPGFKKKVDGALTWITYKYDSRGRVLNTTDPNSNVTSIEYTPFDEPFKTSSNLVGVIKKIDYGTTGIEKGKPITVNTMALEDGRTGKMLTTTFKYDALGRAFNSITNGLVNTDEVTNYYLNSLDLVQWTTQKQTFKGSTNNQVYNIIQGTRYDDSGRNTYNGVHCLDANWNTLGRVTESKPSYMENGWLKNTTITEGYYNNLQQIDYSYNSRGWLTAINEPLFSNNGNICNTPSEEPTCTRRVTNFNALIDFSKKSTCINWGWGNYCLENGVKDMHVTYALSYQDNNGQSHIRTDLPANLIGSKLSYYPYTTQASVTAEIRPDNLEASLDAIAEEIKNVILWRAYATYDSNEAASLAQTFRTKLKVELLQELCPSSDRLFAEKMHYADKHPQLNSATPPQYNGNISWVEWQVGNKRKQAFGYTYDALDRLTGAHYSELKKDGTLNEVAGAKPYDEIIKYKDARGNISNLTRYGVTSAANACLTFGVIDNLTYAYENESNRLTSVTDAATGVGTTKGVVNGGGGYDYDFNGNMTADVSKKLVIKYNFLNLPYEFTFAGQGRIFITYDADGNKLRKEVFNAANVRTSLHDYVNGVEYENNVLEFMNFGFTRMAKDNAVANTYRMEYTLADHLGNNRVTFTDKNGDGRIDDQKEVVQETHFYAYGMQMEGNWNAKTVAGSPKQNYKYNGKELNSDLGLNWSDYHARFYDAIIGRWHTIDPSAEKMSFYSPFNYAFNNPLRFIDPDGTIPNDVIFGTGFMKIYGSAYKLASMNPAFASIVQRFEKGGDLSSHTIEFRVGNGGDQIARGLTQLFVSSNGRDYVEYNGESISQRDKFKIVVNTAETDCPSAEGGPLLNHEMFLWVENLVKGLSSFVSQPSYEEAQAAFKNVKDQNYIATKYGDIYNKNSSLQKAHDLLLENIKKIKFLNTDEKGQEAMRQMFTEDVINTMNSEQGLHNQYYKLDGDRIIRNFEKK